MSIFQTQPDTAWNLEHNILVYNMLAHLNQGLNTNPENAYQILCYSSTYINYIAEKLKTNNIPHQVLMLGNPKDGDYCAVLDCGGSFWSTIGKDLECIFEYMGVSKEKQESFDLYPANLKKEVMMTISDHIEHSYPEIMKKENPIYQPVNWKQLSFLNVKFAAFSDIANKYFSIMIESETPQLLFHEQPQFKKENLNLMIQQYVENHEHKNKENHILLNMNGEKSLHSTNCSSIELLLKNEHRKMNDLFKEWTQQYGELDEKLKRPQQWLKFIIQKISQSIETISELNIINNSPQEFIIEEFAKYSPNIENHKKVAFNIENELQEKIFVNLISLNLINNKEFKKYGSDIRFNVCFELFLSSFLIHSTKYPKMYASTHPSLENFMKKTGHVNITSADQPKDWYYLNEHPAIVEINKQFRQIGLQNKLNDKILPSKNTLKKRF